MRRNKTGRVVIPAIKVRQWLVEWEKISFDPKWHRSKPEPHYYLFQLPATILRKLCGIERRTIEEGQSRAKDLGIQRRHDERRSNEIRQFVQFGYPWSELTETKRRSGEYEDLRKPGWLPTAIVVNILKGREKRRDEVVAAEDLITIEESEDGLFIGYPEGANKATWTPKGLHPIQVIDGQHRLWAFDEFSAKGNFELPVVAFHGLDISWQAYLFWTINIKPKRINASLAFDLYPLLRTEDWLEKIDGHSIYRETRAQELTEALWGHPASPWFQRINMLGEAGLEDKMVSQAAWIRSLMSTYIKPSPTKGIGGLFACPIPRSGKVLEWSRAQQAAFLIVLGQKIKTAVKNSSSGWASDLRRTGQPSLFRDKNDDSAFSGPFTLLNTDQGIRGILHITNDLCFVKANELGLEKWSIGSGDAPDEESIDAALESLNNQRIARFIDSIAESLAVYDWRTSAAPNITPEMRTLKAAFRGSGGYREMRIQLLRHLCRGKDEISSPAKKILSSIA